MAKSYIKVATISALSFLCISCTTVFVSDLKVHDVSLVAIYKDKLRPKTKKPDDFQGIVEVEKDKFAQKQFREKVLSGEFIYQLKVDFTSHMDVWDPSALKPSPYISLESYFCDRSSARELFGYLYWNKIGLNGFRHNPRVQLITRPNLDGLYLYSIYYDLNSKFYLGKTNKDERGILASYDLMEHPEDICFILVLRDIFGIRVKSNMLKINKEMVKSVLKNANKLTLEK